MKENIKNNLSITILVVLFSVNCIFFYFKVYEGQVFAVIFASIATTYYAYLKQKSENDRMFKELFESFNDKYKLETNDVFNELRKSLPEKRIEEIKNAENIVIDYFNLCAEEFLWYSRGRIPKKIWNAWKCGIIENINIPQVKSLYKREIEYGEESFYGLVKELDIKF